MKRIALLIMMIGGFAWSANAQLQQKKPVTVKIATPTVQCEQCKKRIEDYMKGEEGISKVTVDYKRKITTITYLPNRTNLDNVKTGIANAGYDADDVKANEDSYKALPTCCKKPADQ
jgi:copper chaperone CopZ